MGGENVGVCILIDVEARENANRPGGDYHTSFWFQGLSWASGDVESSFYDLWYTGARFPGLVLYWAKRAGGKRMADTPQWQPIERLALIASHIDGMLESATEQYETLQLAKPKPFVLDDYTVGRVIEVFTTQQGDLGLFDEQLRRWERGPLTNAQRREVERLADQMLQLHEVINAILRLAEQLKERTIEKVLAKSDVELGVETLLSGWPTDL